MFLEERNQVTTSSSSIYPHFVPVVKYEFDCQVKSQKNPVFTKSDSSLSLNAFLWYYL